VDADLAALGVEAPYAVDAAPRIGKLKRRGRCPLSPKRAMKRLEKLGIIGFGRFGRALAPLFADAGHQVRAWDAAHAVEPPWGASSLEALAAEAQLLVLATPVQTFGALLAQLGPLLGPQHLVLDVGSVKVRPRQLFEERLGDRVPWVLTHPLFGPASLARGERPLNVVVCPDPARAEAVARVRALFASAGCELFAEDAEAHDRSMASTHALAFFVAKGLMELGGDAPGPLAPPSYLAMARTVETVRADAGHLFWAIEVENPHAAEARAALLAAMTRVHQELAAARELAPSAPDAPPPLSIPDLGAEAPDLREVRALIDELDQELLALVARRGELARRAGRVKRAEGRPIRDPERERRLLAERNAWAQALGVDAPAAEQVFGALLEASRRIQERDTAAPPEDEPA
jgi:prephenate dehydrogenase